jgi:pyruvate/2-oxoglutarate/acetoin dehydrogenase E1 component
MAAAVADPDPVLYYEHIALYRDPRIKQAGGEIGPSPIPIGRAALRRAGDDARHRFVRRVRARRDARRTSS